jgi:putative SOS response-associated peptidase YedK
MCGRYARFAAVEMICRHFGAAMPPAAPPDNLLPSWNVAPQTMQPIPRIDRDTGRRERDTGRREIVLMPWRLMPSFAKSPVFNLWTINGFVDKVGRENILLNVQPALDRTWAIGASFSGVGPEIAHDMGSVKI